MSHGEALTEIANNSRSLLSDAELLAANGRHASACAIAILAIEEVGKYFALKWSEGKSNFHHLEKQRIVATFEMTEAIIGAYINFIQSCGFEIKSRNALSPSQEAWLTSATKEARLLFDNLAVSVAADALQDASTTGMIAEINQGHLAKTKNAALYVDVTKDGAVSSNPNWLGKSESEKILNYAAKCVARLGIQS